MEFPFGHQSHSHTHTHHRRDDDDYEDRDRPPRDVPYPPPPQPPFDHPPPPYYGGGDEFPPPPPPSNVYHTSHVPPPYDPYPPPAQDSGYGNYPPYHRPQESEGFSDYPPQQPPSTVHHVSHETETHHSYRPHMPSFIHHHTSEQQPDSAPVVTVGGGGALASYFSSKSTVKVYCKAEPNYTLTVCDDKVILAPYNPNDPMQQWYKDEKFSTRVKDEEGFPCFSLVNKATGQAIKHSVGASHPVQLIPYSPEQLDSSILWSGGKDLGDGYRAIRMVNNVRLNLDAFHGDKKSGGVHDGTTIVLWQWNKGDNQRWKIATTH
ncbi:ricin B-like lectin EULS3 [Punica granatum]|nr:ricin B-like lectin EULS3 [Punica granatum]OWM73244.1 hypothetical protein CDL15_Pgr001358 [Punica granatum]